MNPLFETISPLTHALAWALLNSLWQGALIFATLFVAWKALPSVSASIKYLVSLLGFSFLFIWFAATWAGEYAQITSYTAPSPVSAVAKLHSNTFTIINVQSPVYHHSLYTDILRFIDHNYNTLLLIYALGLLIMIARVISNSIQAAALRTKGLTLPDSKWEDFILTSTAQFKIPQTVKIFVSDRISVPAMIGVFKPVILLPVATFSQLSTEQVETILLHELAHIRRYDYLVNLFQVLVESLLFFNPFVWLISNTIRKERELCCDDMVVKHTADPLQYASALTILETYRANNNSLALAASGNKNQLLNRIKRIMNMKNNKLGYSRLTMIIAAFFGVIFLTAMFTFSASVAQKAHKQAKADTVKKSVYRYKTVTIDDNGKETVTERVSDKPISDDLLANDQHLSAKDATGSKKVIIVKHVGKDKVVEEIDISDLHKVVCDEATVEMKKVAEDLDKLDDPKLKKEILAEIEKVLHEAEKDKRKDGKEIVDNNVNQKHKIIIRHDKVTNGETVDVVGGNHVGMDDFEKMKKEMIADGLITNSEHLTIVGNSEMLMINGVKQPMNIFDKYAHYFKNSKITIDQSNGELIIRATE